MAWVKRGMTKVWVGPMIDNGPEPAPKPRKVRAAYRPNKKCADCPEMVERRVVRCRACFDAQRGVGEGHVRLSPPSAIEDVMARIGRQLAARPLPPLGVICDDCGCLNRRDERCLNCLLWAELDAAKWSWRTPLRSAA